MISAPPIQVCLCSEADSESDVRRILEQAGFQVGSNSFTAGNGSDLAQFNLLLVEGTASPASLQFCQSLRQRLGDHFVPILYITSDSRPVTRLASMESGADAYLLRPFEPAELLAHARALMRIKERHDRLIEKTAEVHRINKRLQSAYQQIDRELELAGRIQVSFLPHKLPEVPRVRFAVRYKPCGRVGGDFYDVFRLDENHFGLYVADAMGHGVPASLLTIFVKKGIVTKEISGHSYRLVPPSEVLSRLNRDLIEQELSDNPFITMVYALFNHADGTFQFARSGHPYPIYLPHDGGPQQWRVEGTLLGVFDTEYQMFSHPVQPGDRIILHTDGLDGVRYRDAAAGPASLMRCLEDHRHLSLEEMVEKTTSELIQPNEQKDDVTLLALEMVQEEKKE